ncbi:hypothetical protein [Burkholderia perseverans]|uniref:hypothetical protein n=1 Tax=Burkholderia perseverans TaxID=2615214 RepID=UPI001FEF82EA|nr:hypothetical protein [Burkholderia perseverans]
MAPKGIKGSGSTRGGYAPEDFGQQSGHGADRSDRNRGEPRQRSHHNSSLVPSPRQHHRAEGSSRAGGSSSNAEPSADLAQHVRHLRRNDLSSNDRQIHAEVEAYRMGGTRPQHPVAVEIMRRSRRFMPQVTQGTVADRTEAIAETMIDLGAAPSAPPPAVAPDAHRRVAGAIDSHLFGQGEVDGDTRALIDEMLAFETRGARPPSGSPMRPIADIMQRGLARESTQVDRQNVMFLALSDLLGVHPNEVLGPPDRETGLPSNVNLVVEETSTMADWMAEVAMRGADPDTRRAANQINRFIETGEIPYGMDEDTARIIEVASRETSPAGSPSGSPHSRPGGLAPRLPDIVDAADATTARRNVVTRMLLQVMNNEGGGTFRRGAYSTANSLMRNVATVMVPTMLRQYLDQGIASRMDRLTEHEQLGLSLTAALIPPLLLSIGAYVDRDKATTASNISRATLALVSFGAIAAAVSTGNMASLGPALIGYLTYAAMRDLGQKFIKLDNPDANPDMRLATTMKGAGAYVANQTIAGAMMTYLASPSGAGAAGMPLEALNGFLRGVINGAAESGDDVTYNSFASREVGQSLRLTLSGAVPTLGQLGSTYTTTSPARATLSTVDAMLSTVVGAALARTNLSATAQDNLGNLFGAAVLGVLYSAFLHIHQEPPAATSTQDVESGRPRIRVSGDGGESFGMDRLSLDDRSTRSGFTGNVGLGGGSSIRALPPSTRVPSTRSRSSSVQGLAPSSYGGSRPPSMRRDYPPPRDERFDDRGLSDNPFAPQPQFLAPPPPGQFGGGFGPPYPPQMPPQPPADRLRDRFNRGGGGGFEGPPLPPHMQQQRDPSIRSHHSDSTAFYSFESESAESRYYTPGGSNRSQRSRRSEDDDPGYR